MTNEKLAKVIVELIGTSDNVNTITACQTRLRFALKDNALAQTDELKKVDGVLGINITDVQYQVIIGTGVDKVLKEVEKLVGPKDESSSSNKEEASQSKPVTEKTAKGMAGNFFKFIFDYLSTAFSPILIAILGAGIIKGFNILFTGTLGLYTPDSGIGNMMTLMGDVPFYFLPFLIAYGAAKKLNTNIALALTLAGAYMYPTISAGAQNGDVWDLLGFNVPLIGYNGTVLPILFSVLFMSVVYKWIDRIVPSSIRIIFVPIVVFIIVIPVQLLILGPMGYYLSGYVAVGLEWLFSTNRWIAGFLYGATRQMLVMTGLHLSLTPIIMENIRVLGGDYLMPVHAMSSMAVAGTALGIYFKAKNPKVKTAAIATFIPGIIGVTEPGIFGLAVRFVKPWIPIAIGGGLGAAYVSGMGAESVAISIPGPLSFAIFADTLPIMIVGWVISLVSSFVIAYIIGVDETL